MSVSGNEPISSENLSAALQAALEKPAREVLQTFEISQYMTDDAMFYADPDEFDAIEVSFLGNGESSSFENQKVYVFTCPLSEGDHDVGYADKCNISASSWDEGLWFVYMFGLSVFRIVGIRSGGQLVADLIAALKGVV